METALGAIPRSRPSEEGIMPEETNEASPRGTRARPESRKGGWLKRLLRTVFWLVWAIDKVLTFVAWITGSPPS